PRRCHRGGLAPAPPPPPGRPAAAVCAPTVAGKNSRVGLRPSKPGQPEPCASIEHFELRIPAPPAARGGSCGSRAQRQSTKPATKRFQSRPADSATEDVLLPGCARLL